MDFDYQAQSTLSINPDLLFLSLLSSHTINHSEVSHLRSTLILAAAQSSLAISLSASYASLSWMGNSCPKLILFSVFALTLEF
jgi:hypothetical protein